MTTQVFNFINSFPSLQSASLELNNISQRLNNQKCNYISFLAYMYSHWECCEVLHVIQYFFSDNEDRLEAAKAELVSLEKQQEKNQSDYFNDEYLEGLIKCAKHLIELLSR